jgi:minichromosome maintenance protein 10
VNGPNRDAPSLFVAETIGREDQARKLIQDADRELEGLLERDEEGMRAVSKAREIGAKTAKRSSSSAKDKPSAKGKQNTRDTNDVSGSDDATTSKAYQTGVLCRYH